MSLGDIRFIVRYKKSLCWFHFKVCIMSVLFYVFEMQCCHVVEHLEWTSWVVPQ